MTSIEPVEYQPGYYIDAKGQWVYLSDTGESLIIVTGPRGELDEYPYSEFLYMHNNPSQFNGFLDEESE